MAFGSSWHIFIQLDYDLGSGKDRRGSLLKRRLSTYVIKKTRSMMVEGISLTSYILSVHVATPHMGPEMLGHLKSLVNSYVR